MDCAHTRFPSAGQIQRRLWIAALTIVTAPGMLAASDEPVPLTQVHPLNRVEPAEPLPPPAQAAPAAIVNEPERPDLASASPGQELFLSLPECIQFAFQHQPALAANRATLASAEANRRGLNDIRVPSLFVRELPIRRRQADLGVALASALLDQTEHETKYAVTRTYISVLYARAQKQVVETTVARFRATLQAAKPLAATGQSRDVTTNSVDKITVYLHLAESRRPEAERGIDRALAALKEAIGLDPSCCLRVPEQPLPNIACEPCCADVVNQALAQRAELAQARILAQMSALEADAQATSHRLTSRTFAAVLDLHSRPVPAGMQNAEYRPGALSPEMPTTLVGPKADRVDRARALGARADEVVAKTRNLIALEAEDAFLSWREAAQRVRTLRTARDLATKLVNETGIDFAGDTRVRVEDVLTNEVIEAQAAAQYNEAHYHEILALIALERITAGGFCVDLSSGHSARLPSMSDSQVTGQ